ncbi:MAG: efflux family protein [Myxococcaceae bacterium]|nr:efflux family protein [Myxococcaceae bacterium]
MSPELPLTRRRVFLLAWPIILANATVPLLGLVDTAIIGNAGSVLDLGAIALGSLILSFLYWSFGFLRMATTGFIAQAAGAGDEPEVRATFARALLMAGLVGLLLIVLQRPLCKLSLQLLHGSPGVETVAARYLELRLWGAPASLATLAVRGTLIGLGYTRTLLWLELLLNGLNLSLNLLFVLVFHWGASGVALGTALSEWVALLGSLSIVLLALRRRQTDDEPFWGWARIKRADKLRALLGANADIMIRTVLLLLGFGWFTDQGARFGDVVLAANHVLLQLVSFSAFFLDGYAFVAESLIGRAIGARERTSFDLAVRRSSELAWLSALVLSLALLALGPSLIELLTDLPSVREETRVYLPYAASYVLLAVGAFQLDGIFIGATRTRDMRNAALLSTASFVVLAWWLAGQLGNQGLWLAFIAFVVLRAVALGARFPELRRSLAPAASGQACAGRRV